MGYYSSQSKQYYDGPPPDDDQAYYAEHAQTGTDASYDLLYDDDGHPLDDGHALVTDAEIAEFLELHRDVGEGVDSGGSGEAGSSGSEEERYPEPPADPGADDPDGDSVVYDEDVEGGETAAGLTEEEIAMLNVPEKFLDPEPFEERCVRGECQLCVRVRV